MLTIDRLHARLPKPLPRCRTRRRRLPTFEPLEGRIGLAGLTITVTSLDDVAQPDATTLRQAIGLANATSESTITFDPALFAAGPGVIALSGALPDITQATTIDGPGAAVLDLLGVGSTPYRILTVDAGATANLSGLTIDGGDIFYGGGGVVNEGTLSIDHCTFVTNNFALTGGALENLGIAKLVDSLFMRNTSSSGGAIDNNVGGTMTILGTTFITNDAIGGVGGAILNRGTMSIAGGTFSNNSSQNGGGICNFGSMTLAGGSLSHNFGSISGGAIENEFGRVGPGRLVVTDCIISDNGAEAVGPAIDNSANLSVARTSISDNSGYYNGAISNAGVAVLTECAVSGNGAFYFGAIGNGGTLSVINSTIIGNSGLYDGAIRNDGDLTLTNSTVTANRTLDLTSDNVNQDGGTIKLFNSIVVGNLLGLAPSAKQGDIAGTVDPSSAFNLIGTGGGLIVDAAHHNRVGVAVADAKLGTFGDHGGPTSTVDLLPGSPAIDGGSIALAVDAAGQPLLTDQRGDGFARVVGRSVDIGAFEASPAGTELAVASAHVTYGSPMHYPHLRSKRPKCS
jgi:fibronectin-binding autotransporter adhesin